MQTENKSSLPYCDHWFSIFVEPDTLSKHKKREKYDATSDTASYNGSDRRLASHTESLKIHPNSVCS